MKRQQKLVVWTMGLILVAFAAGCRKKAPVAAAPAPPAPAAPAAVKPNAPTISEFAAEPGRIERGQSALLRWQVKDATEVEINRGVGGVPVSGRRQIQPNESTTYTLVAKGPGGTATADATLSVTMPAPAPVAAAPAATATLAERLTKEVEDAFFDYDRSDLREDARAALAKDAAALQTILNDFPTWTIVIEGHCDERGSAEYNLPLGDRRVLSAKSFLTQLGVPADRLSGISYGKERPQCTESNESCWQKNRRVHFVPGENRQMQTASVPQE